MKSSAAKRLEFQQQSDIASARLVRSWFENYPRWSRSFNVRSSNSGGAVFDKSGNYRYLLWRNVERDPSKEVQEDSGTLLFVMLNPNKADESRNDPTIRRCIGFSKSWGFSRLEVVNLFAVCAEKPQMLIGFENPVGSHNDEFILERAARAGRIVVAWGNHGLILGRDANVVAQLKTNRPLECFGTTKLGMPRHPLYVRADSAIKIFGSTTSSELEAKKARELEPKSTFDSEAQKEGESELKKARESEQKNTFDSESKTTFDSPAKNTSAR
ncbi:MAG: DUF1643 domain-containing protein [Candidatus Melainabacteria bacterium]|nr:DUF1643 domain-containing protein [Candidatus Melainabacteria bacterium]